ncbi:GNAT family N-acetyltransferase [Halosquirtibacter laminarini]|uniref:GNAT family N-acetyltransferase n=1 Tax=Halosquirtibacter laminarini TaxID=3374600 RepID=A0AC61NLK7_9BACT|nr:GNAT family N-acetyltransferase [Prolixibacteraceae bacterium]
MENIVVSIRKASCQDIPDILAIVKDAVKYMNANGNYQWSVNYPTKDVFLNDISLNELWVAVCGDVIAGVAAINMEHTPEYDTLVWEKRGEYWGIHRIAISKQFKGKRVAESFFQKAEDIARESGTNYIRIDTNILNKSAQRLFERLGYGYCGQVYFAKTETPFVCYDKLLED